MEHVSGHIEVNQRVRRNDCWWRNSAWKSSKKSSDWKVSGVDDKIASKTVEWTSSRVDDTSKSLKKSSERTAAGFDKKLASKALEGTALILKDTSQSANNHAGCQGWNRMRKNHTYMRKLVYAGGPTMMVASLLLDI